MFANPFADGKYAHWRDPAIAIAVVAGYALSAFTSLEYLRDWEGRTALYTSNAILISGLVLLAGRIKWQALALIGSALACFAIVAGRGLTPVYAVGAGVIAAIVCAAGAWLTSKVLRGGRLRNIKQAVKLLAFVIVPASAMSGVLSALWLNIRVGTEIAPTAFAWFMASITGTSMILPTALMLITPNKVRNIRRSGPEMVALGAVLAGLLLAPFIGLYYLALLLMFPIANLFALRLGGRWTAVSLTVSTLLLFVFPYVFDRESTAPEGARFIILGFQIYIVAVFYNGLLTSLAIDHQTRIKRQLEQRTAIARAARSKALAASRAKTMFLAAMSHELRTPLNGVMGFSEVLLQKKLSADVRRKVDLIRRSGDALLVVVNDILDFSRMESGEAKLVRAPAKVPDIARDALDIASAEATAKKLKTSLSVEGDPGGEWMIDEGRVRQVLLNLLNNAVKFTEAGSVAVHVRFAHGGVRFEVRDTGIGVPADAVDTLFDSFTRVEETLTRSHGGAGLGLAICKRLVDLMDGTIGVKSRLGHGSTFWFEIPLTAAQPHEAAPVEETAERPAHILVVDDHPVNRELAVTVLGLLGCTADAVDDGAEAVEAMKTGRYDAVLMDVHMPVMDGITATRAIRALGAAAGATPIIGLSADVLPESVEACMAAGMDDHLGKPVNVVKLQTSLLRCFNADVPRSEAAA